MKAVVIERDAAGGARPVLAEVAAAEPGAREVRVRIRAAGMNRADLGLKTGHSPGMTGTGADGIAGLEMAGEVLRCGSGVTRFRTGDRVMAMCCGAHAEQVCVDERLLMRVPDGMDWTHAATLPVALMTAHDALVTHGRLTPGNAVLVQAASSAVGIVAVQMAAALGAGVVIGTSTSPEKRERLASLGLRHALAGGDGLAAEVQALTQGRGVDVLIDHLGAQALAGNMACAALGGRIISVGRMTGTRTEIDMDLLSLKRLSLIGVTFRTRTADDVATLIERMGRDVWPMLAAGRIQLPLDRVFALADVGQAHAWMKARQQFGKVVLQPD